MIDEWVEKSKKGGLWYYYDEVDIGELKGKTITAVRKPDDEHIFFETDDGNVYCQLHMQDCCEYVSVEDIVGDLDDLVGGLVINAEAVCYESFDELSDVDKVRLRIERANNNEYYEVDSESWTFYKIDTNKGGVTIRWYGESNGYYSEEANFVKFKTLDKK